MPATISSDWQQIAIYAVAAALILILLQKIPYVGRIIRFALSLALLAFSIFLLIQYAPYEPVLGRLSDRLGIDNQEVVGKEVRLRMANDGHFWANVSMNGVKLRMLIDSGATVTAISEQTAAAVGIDSGTGLLPVILRTANGVAAARTGTVSELRVGNILARDLKVVISPSLGNLNVLGMNFLSRLRSWRVEGRTIILVPHNPQPVARQSQMP